MPGIQPYFIQDGPQLGNTYEDDALLKSFLRMRLSKPAYAEIAPELAKFGARCSSEFLQLAAQAESEPPRHVPYDAWGRRVDRIEVSSAWERLHEISAEEGLIAIGYERKHGGASRLHQFAKLYLFHPSSAFYTCPLAMTDGAARVIELSGPIDLKKTAFKSLTSRDPKEFWTSGQWMTEKTGGSDVSGTSTVAKKSGSGAFALHGDKWFTSATTSQMSLALAKVEGASDPREGLSLFFVELRDSQGSLKKIRINRLKDKLGTKALPTAELTLEGTPGVMVGEVGEGVKRVSSMLNITRLYNSTCAIGTGARAVALAKDYAKRRTAFGRKLAELPLHLQTLADMQVEHEAVFVLTFHMIHLLGKDECGEASAEESALLRLMTPITKLWSAKQSIAIASETLESIGGAAYIEDSGLPKLLRDAQVFSIWEGTTNVLSLDALRAIAKENALAPLFADVEAKLKAAGAGLDAEAGMVRAAAQELQSHFKSLASAGADAQQAAARAFALGLARVYSAALLLEYAGWCAANGERPAAVDVARRFCRRSLVELHASEDLDPAKLARIVYG